MQIYSATHLSSLGTIFITLRAVILLVYYMRRELPRLLLQVLPTGISKGPATRQKCLIFTSSKVLSFSWGTRRVDLDHVHVLLDLDISWITITLPRIIIHTNTSYVEVKLKKTTCTILQNSVMARFSGLPVSALGPVLRRHKLQYLHTIICKDRN